MKGLILISHVCAGEGAVREKAGGGHRGGKKYRWRQRFQFYNVMLVLSMWQ